MWYYGSRGMIYYLTRSKPPLPPSTKPMPKYRLLLESGRDLIFNSKNHHDNPEEVEDLAYEAIEEAALMDDYFIDIERIYV